MAARTGAPWRLRRVGCACARRARTARLGRAAGRRPRRVRAPEIARLDRLAGLLRRADPLLRGVEHEDLEAARRLEHDLAVVGDHRPAREPLHLAHERRGHHVLEAHPHLAHELAGAAVVQRHLGRGQDVFEDDEDVLVEDRRPRSRRSLAVEVAHDPHDRVGQRRLKLSDPERLVVLGHTTSIPVNDGPCIVECGYGQVMTSSEPRLDAAPRRGCATRVADPCARASRAPAGHGSGP